MTLTQLQNAVEAGRLGVAESAQWASNSPRLRDSLAASCDENAVLHWAAVRS